MIDEPHVLIASRSEEGLRAIQSAVGKLPGASVDRLVMANGHTDPISSLPEQPDVLILHSGTMITEELEALARRPVQSLPALLIFGDPLPPAAVKFAVRAGAREILESHEGAELSAALHDLLRELQGSGETDEGQVIAVVNAKGGSGATFIAINLAHLAATQAHSDTVVVDLDFQFGSLPQYLDVTPKRSLLEALAQVNELDRVAIDAFTTEHASGLHVMAPVMDTHVETDFDISERVKALLAILRSRFQTVVIDLPRHVDEVSSPIIYGADHILMVMQQSLPSIRDAVRLKTTLVRDMGVSEKRVHAVLNRHLKAGSIELADIKEALGEDKIFTVPNHFKSVGEAIDMGIPIADVAASSPVVKALTDIRKHFISGSSANQSAGRRGATAIERLKQWSPF